MNEHPPWYDDPAVCDVCGKGAGDCDCPVCPECGAVGDPDCYDAHGLEPAHDSIKAFCEYVGIEPFKEAMKAINRHEIGSSWIVLAVPVFVRHSDDVWSKIERVYYDSHGFFDALKPWMRIRAVGVGGSAWDGSNWEWSKEADLVGSDWSVFDELRDEFSRALDEYCEG